MLWILISYVPATDYKVVINILNCIPNTQKLDEESYVLMIDGILMPIKEAF